MIKLVDYVVKPTMFPDKSSQVWLIPEPILNSVNIVTWDFEDEAELSHVLQLSALLTVTQGSMPSLYMPYLVYGRQDKPISNNTTFAKNVIMGVLSKFFSKISTLDAHSSMVGIDNIDPLSQLGLCVAESNPEVICYPDKGASLRGYENFNRPTINLDKARDQLTGEIIGLCITQDDADKVKGKRVLICDDICDGGRTFIEAAKVLKASGAESVCLYTTHGIYSKGTQVLFNSGLDRVFNRKGEIKNAN